MRKVKAGELGNRVRKAEQEAEVSPPSNQEVAKLDVPLGPIAQIQSHFSKELVMAKIASHCGTDVNGVERIVRDLINAVRSSGDERLKLCTPASFVNCIYEAHALNLRIDARQHCYLVRYGDRATLAPGYKGYAYRLQQNLKDCDIQTFLIWEEDEFAVSYEDGLAKFSYKPAKPFRTDYGKIIGAACYISFWVGGEKKAILERMGKEDVDKIRSKAKTQGVWNEWYSEQVKKSVLRRACKLRFSSITDDLDAIDNDHFDMKPEEKVTQADKFNAKMANPKYNPFPGEEVKVTEAIVVPNHVPGEGKMAVPDHIEDPRDMVAGDHFGDSNKMVTEPDNNNKNDIVIDGACHPHPYDGIEPWDGKIYLNGLQIDRKVSSLKEAGMFLIEEMAKIRDRNFREALADDNLLLIATLYDAERGLHDAINDLIEQGESSNE